MLVELGGRQVVAGGVAGEPDRVADRRDCPLTCPDLDDRVEADLLGEAHSAVDAVDRRARHTGADEDLEPLVGRPGAQALDEERSQLLTVRRAVLVAGEAGVVRELGDAENLDELAELPRVAGCDDEVAVRARERLVGEEARVAVAHPERDHTAGDEGAGLVDHAGQRRGEEVDLDVLALTRRRPRVEGREDPDRRMHAGDDVEDRDPRSEGGALGVAGEAHEAGDGLDHEVVAREVAALLAAAEAADRRIDDAGVARGDAVVVEPEARQAAGLEVLDEDVGATGELVGEAAVLLALEVEGDGALVPVDGEVVGRGLAAHRRHPAAGVVTARGLDLDDLGAEVGEEHRRVWPGEDPGEVGDE